MNRQRQPAPAAAAPVITTAIQPPAAIAPAEPGPIPMEQRVSSTYVPNMQVAPIVQQPEYQPEAPRYTVPRAYNGRQNRKLNGILGATDEN
jgi:hypothetical protein